MKKIIVNYSLSLREMIGILNVKYIDEGIDLEKIQLNFKGNKEFEVKTISIKEKTHTDHVVKLIVKDDTSNPWAPASIEHLIFYSKQYIQEIQQGNLIVALGTVIEKNGVKNYPCLSSQFLIFEESVGRWREHAYFLAIREVK